MSILIERTKDMLLENEDLEELAEFSHFPIFMGVSNDPSSMDIYEDMRWMISKGSGMIQLGGLVPDSVLYKKSHNSGIGKVWTDHYIEFSRFLKEQSDNGGILEIGGGNGILNKLYNDLFGNREWIIVEPSDVGVVEGCTAEYIRTIWNENLDQNLIPQSYETIVHTHVLEHLLDLNSFMRTVSQRMRKGQKMVFSIPNLKETLKRKYTNALNFEHTYLLTDDYVEYILKCYGFRVLAKEKYREEHSIFYSAIKQEAKEQNYIDFGCLFDENKKIFNDYVEYHRSLVKELNEKMKYSSDAIFLFGAHIFSQYLVHFGLDVSRIRFVLDNDPMKQGARLYGTELLVESPKILKNVSKPIVILKVASYAEEIKREIMNSINANTEFWC